MMQIVANGLSYYVEPKGEGIPLMLLHGFMGSARTWDRHIGEFSQRYHTLAVDLPGHGLTEAPVEPSRHDISKAAADIVNILDQCGFDKVHLIGYSMGGRLAMYIAAIYPQRLHSLILESASPGLATYGERSERLRSDEALADRLERDGLPAFVDYWETLPLFASQKHLPDDVRAAVRSERLKNNPAGIAGSLRGMGTGAQPSLWERLPGIDVPTLMMAGELDTKFVEIGQRMAAPMPNARLEIVGESGHTVHLEQPERWKALVLGHLDFLDRHGADPETYIQ